MPWSRFHCEMRCCKDAGCTAAHNNNLLSVCFSHLSILPHTWNMKVFFDLPQPLSLWNFFMFSLLCLRLFFSRLSCCSRSSKLALLARSKNTSQKKPARCLYPFRIFLCLRHWGYVSICLHPFLLCRLLNLWLCLAEGTQHVNVTKQPTRDCTGI